MADFKLVHVTFHPSSVNREAAEQAAWERAHQIAEVPGLIWKIWIHQSEHNLAGGVYLFQDQASAEAYLTGSIFSDLRALPGESKLTVSVFDVDEPRSQLTRGPLPTESVSV